MWPCPSLHEKSLAGISFALDDIPLTLLVKGDTLV